jgi:glycosyltransferase involved in cell wall biosynthesis
MKGEYWLQKNYPFTYQKIQILLEKTASEKLQEIVKEVNFDLIHSFEMFHCTYPILNGMRKHKVKWIYSCWGSDLYFYARDKKRRNKISKVLKRIDLFVADCKRDYQLALELGYRGPVIDAIPGGGGIEISDLNMDLKRTIILVKGYEHKFGRAINVLKSLISIYSQLVGYTIVVFAAHDQVIKFIKEQDLPIQFYGRHELTNSEVLSLMTKTLIYIGNSLSDGIPNTLLEAMSRGAYPIQSEVGGAISEVIEDGKNGLIINNAESIEEIAQKVVYALKNNDQLLRARHINLEIIKNNYEWKVVGQKIETLYQD